LLTVTVTLDMSDLAESRRRRDVVAVLSRFVKERSRQVR